MSSSERKSCGFEEALLSGFIDGMLAQGQRQRAAVHLQSCHECAKEVEDLRTIREAAMSTEFTVPPDDQWDETPTSALSRLLRNVGWAALLLWFLFTLGVLLVAPDWSGRTIELTLVGGSVLGFGVLLLSAGLDRWRTARGDIYRGVEK